MEPEQVHTEAVVAMECDGLLVNVAVCGDESWAASAILDRAQRAAREALQPEVARTT